MEQPSIRSYPPEIVISEKFQAGVALGLANARMMDFYDLWAVPQMKLLAPDALDAAIAAPIESRGTAIPAECSTGLLSTMSQDA